ncbi:MAG: hypothetical protein BZY75_01510 [SAR202 cluster bacterium Io17-Chloro-G7]|nr:MAG: hypothetical protein BZY75_01510 [SAR202 cluster bacterium Io17-Chloro-G7]
MSAPLLRIGIFLLLPIAALAFFLGAYFFFYRGGYEAPPPLDISFEHIVQPTSSKASFSEVPQIHEGTLLVDGVHRNEFTKEEISPLLAKIADRGYSIDIVGETARDGRFIRLRSDNPFDLFAQKLRQADSLAVILPNEPFSSKEADLVERFLAKGGRLLLIGDPTRDHDINSLAARFGVRFQPGYLYNTIEYDLNFQNIYVRDFRPDLLTQGIGQVVFYTAGSVKSSGPGLAYTDGNTRSTVVERVEQFFPMVKTSDDQVVAIGDMTFMVPPRNAILDNDRLISNIADFLTTGQRTFDLGDFPYFLGDNVEILLGSSTLIGQGTAAKALLTGLHKNSRIVGSEDIAQDTVYLGLYQDASDVAQYLEVNGIRVGDSLRTPFTPDLDKKGSGLMLFHKGPDRNVFVILGDTEGSITDMLDQLGSSAFRAGLVSDFVGVYRTP